jgi:glycerol uptake facilitator-like aquaporin
MLAHAFSEFFGTALLLSAIAFSGQTIVIVITFLIAVYITGPISGGHMNPAVTLWAYLSNKIGYSRAVMHVLAQLLAAVLVWTVKSRV